MSRHKSRPIDEDKQAAPGIRTKIYVRGDMIGSGKVDLLRKVAETGSISAAAREMGLGYRRAWFLLDTLQRCFEAPLFSSERGGPGKGGSVVTELGRELLERVAADTEGHGKVENFPKMEGRQMIMLIGPLKT